MIELTAFEHYVKSVIEAYGTQPGKPLNLPNESVKRLCKKLFLIKLIKK